MPRQVRWFVHEELVGVDRSLDDVLAQAVGAGDEHYVAESRLGVQGEHHTGGGQVGANHLHDTDGQACLEVIESLVDAVVDGPVQEEAGEAPPARLEEAGFARAR